MVARRDEKTLAMRATRGSVEVMNVMVVNGNDVTVVNGDRICDFCTR